MLDDIHLVPEGKTCSTILKLYNEDAIVVKPARVLSIACLNDYARDKENGPALVGIEL
ncbi:MAG TPA: hypothetical protein VM101_07060 [Flavitalea sp.]|nr:hypothetical protein [Flavitalea sp.]